MIACFVYNAAMRDGHWKLVRPALPEAMEVASEDMAMDVALKYQPDAFSAIRDEPFPEREIGPIPPAQLFDLDADPGEQLDLAAAEPGRVSRMEAELAAWFEDVMA